MDKNDITKKYSNGEITVVWQSGKCIHSANCVNNLPQVFNTKESPWIQVDKATTNEIVQTVKKCPSGALSIIKAT
jgi:uncharacterized Fe-S cluster protein YjdI